MGFLDLCERGVNYIREEGERKRESILKNFAQKCRTLDAPHLLMLREKHINEGNYDVVEIIERELDRRGEYY